MNTEQERAEFEAWATSQWLVLQRTVHGEDYQDIRTQGAWEAYQAGRAALQSPEIQAWKKDAERYRWLRDDNAYFPEENYIWGGQELDEAIDNEMEKQK